MTTTKDKAMNKAAMTTTNFYTRRRSVTGLRIEKDENVLIEFTEGPLRKALLSADELDDIGGIRERLLDQAERLELDARCLRQAASMPFDIPSKAEYEALALRASVADFARFANDPNDSDDWDMFSKVMTDDNCYAEWLPLYQRELEECRKKSAKAEKAGFAELPF